LVEIAKWQGQEDGNDGETVRDMKQFKCHKLWMFAWVALAEECNERTESACTFGGAL
jgi:hypothetical protein